MSLFTLHADIASQLFVGSVLQRPGIGKPDLAYEAIRNADLFIKIYEAEQKKSCPKAPEPALSSMSQATFPDVRHR